MPDPSQRDSFLIYVRDAFHRRGHLSSNSREALLAYRDGLDEVEQMEYYHKQMRLKQNGKQSSNRYLEETSQMIVSDTPRSKNEIGLASKGANANENNIAQWLLQHLPHLNHEDLTKYSQIFVDDGFDDVAFIEKELLVEDLSFMKKAHRRVFQRVIERHGRKCETSGAKK